MPAASASAATARRARAQRAGARVRAGQASSPGLAAATRLRWDRLGRIALLLVLVALLYLYLSAGLHLLWKVSQEHAHETRVRALAQEHAQLLHEHEQLSKQSTLEAEARQLGMIRPGEQPFIVTGLPRN